jgi:ubiquinone/menaquinone biosynthesis C-methylase UbiE
MHPVNKVERRQISYTGYAPQYDARRFAGRQNQYVERIRIRGVLRSVGMNDFGRRVLDVGCGTGRGPIALANAGFSNLTAVDFTEAMLRLAQEKLRPLPNRGAVRLVRGDAFSLPFPDASFDLVMSLKFFHMFKFSLQQEILAELTRVCRPGGLLVIELSSVHKGLFVTRYLEQRRVRAHQKFNSCREVYRLFDKSRFKQRRIIGTVLPKAYKLLQHFPSIGERVEAIAYAPPFNWLATHVVVAATRR